jgi:hypothetical protein
MAGKNRVLLFCERLSIVLADEFLFSCRCLKIKLA